jgi:hypothetical protein
MKNLPKGCFYFKDHKRILAKNIDNTRPCDQVNISCERVIRNFFVVNLKMRIPFFRPQGYWQVLSATSYEMAGDYHPNSRYMGGKCWEESDLTGLEWHFRSRKEADNFIFSH